MTVSLCHLQEGRTAEELARVVGKTSAYDLGLQKVGVFGILLALALSLNLNYDPM